VLSGHSQVSAGDQFAQQAAIASSHGELGAIAKDDGVVAVRDRTKLTDVLDIHDRRAMHANEGVCIKGVLQGTHGHANHVISGL
jgi:hypothetical protein